jgi:group I intron endonuclease
MICIYSITNKIDGKKYVGKTKNFARRKTYHLSEFNSSQKRPSCNRHLYRAVKKYGIQNFKFEILESFDQLDESNLSERELFWMGELGTLSREHGYNLRSDSSTRCFVHEETRKLLSEKNKGAGNPNAGNYWSDKKKGKMSEAAKNRHSSGSFYGEEWRKKISDASKLMWKDEQLKAQMAEKVRLKKLKYNFEQYTKSGELIEVWSDIASILAENPSYKWQNIYSVCNGYKKSYMGFVWKKVLKDVGYAGI